MGKQSEQLHRLYDGELPAGVSRGELEASLDADDHRRLAAIGDVGAAVRHTLATEARGVDVWAAVAARIQPAAAPVVPGKVLPFRRLARDYRVLVPALAAAAAFAFFIGRGGPTLTNRCDIESLEVQGGVATVFQMPDKGDTSTTVIWMEN